MDESFAKAYLRKSQGLSHLQRFLEALATAEEGLLQVVSSGKGRADGVYQELYALVQDLKASALEGAHDDKASSLETNNSNTVCPTSQVLGPDGRGPSGDSFSSLDQDGGLCLNMNGLDEMD